MKNIYEIIDLVRLRPQMYIGENKLSTLTSFLAGVHFALGINGVKEFPEFNKFHAWVREEKFKLNPLSVGYCKTILGQTNGDEKKGLEMFFELIDEFKNEKN